MMNGRRFVCIAVGVLALAMSYRLGVEGAIAQGGPSVVTLIPVGPGGGVLDSSGRFFWRDIAGVWHQSPTQAPAGTPVDVKVFFAEREYGQVYWLAMANGDVYTWGLAGWRPDVAWEFSYAGNAYMGTVQAGQASWGKLKDAYRK